MEERLHELLHLLVVASDVAAKGAVGEATELSLYAVDHGRTEHTVLLKHRTLLSRQSADASQLSGN